MGTGGNIKEYRFPDYYPDDGQQYRADPATGEEMKPIVYDDVLAQLSTLKLGANKKRASKRLFFQRALSSALVYQLMEHFFKNNLILHCTIFPAIADERYGMHPAGSTQEFATTSIYAFYMYQFQLFPAPKPAVANPPASCCCCCPHHGQHGQCKGPVVAPSAPPGPSGSSIPSAPASGPASRPPPDFLSAHYSEDTSGDIG